MNQADRLLTKTFPISLDGWSAKVTVNWSLHVINIASFNLQLALLLWLHSFNVETNETSIWDSQTGSATVRGPGAVGGVQSFGRTLLLNNLNYRAWSMGWTSYPSYQLSFAFYPNRLRQLFDIPNNFYTRHNGISIKLLCYGFQIMFVRFFKMIQWLKTDLNVKASSQI